MPKTLSLHFQEYLVSHSHDENAIQGYLEHHTELIPTPFLLNHHLHHNCVIAKYQLGQEFVTDFAYLTKSSNQWLFVLMEIEAADKSIFHKNRPTFTAEFNAALNQVEQWQAYIHTNGNDLINRTSVLRRPLSDNSVDFKYVLVYGRNSEITSQEQRNYIASKNRSGNLRIMTYDSLISEYDSSPVDVKKVVLSPRGDRGFKIKDFPEGGGVNTSIFSKLNPSELDVPQSLDAIIIRDGYDIASWRTGKMLIVDNKFPREHIADIYRKETET